MENKPPTFADAINTLERVNKELETLKNVVEIFLCDLENFALIPPIIEQARKSNKGSVTSAWIMRKFRKGYSRSRLIIDLMLKDGLIEPRKSRANNAFRVLE